jgi:hypothetical protein
MDDVAASRIDAGRAASARAGPCFDECENRRAVSSLRPPPRDGAEQPLYRIGPCQPVSYFLTKPFEAERLLDIANAFLVELGYVPGMPGRLYARYFQRRRVLRHLGAEAVRQAAIDQNEVDLERREQQYRRRFFP